MNRLAARIGKIALLFLSVSFFLNSAPIAHAVTDEINTLDTTPEVTAPLDTDRASKYLIVNAVAGQHRITAPLALGIISSLLVDPNFQDGIGLVLREGDYRMARTLRQMLLALGMSDFQAEGMLRKIATADSHLDPNVQRMMETAANQAAAEQILLDYMIQTPETYPQMVSGLSAFWDQPNLRLSKLLRQRFESFLLPAQWNQLFADDLATRWKFDESVEKELTRVNVFSEFIHKNAKDVDQSPYRIFWAHWIGAVNDDPLLQREMVERLENSTLVYNRLQATLSRSLAINGHPLLTDYIDASQIPNSRYERVIKLLFGDNTDDTQMSEAASPALHQWAQAIGSDRLWSNYLLWHLTRAASSLGTTTLAAISQEMGENADLAQAAADVVSHSDLTTRQMLSDEGVDTKEFRTRRTAGKLTNSDWLDYGHRLGLFMESQPVLAEQLLASKSPTSDTFFATAMSLSMRDSNPMLSVWCETMLKADSLLRNHFLIAAVHDNAIRDPAEGPDWLSTVLLHANDTMNPQVAQFKTIWAAWMRSVDGRTVARQRLSLETWGVPHEVSEILVDGWSDNVEDYLKWRRMASYLPLEKGGIIRRDAIVLSRQSNFVVACLNAIMAGDLAVNDITVPLWKTLFLRPKGELVEAFQHEFTEGSILGDPYSAGAIALADAIDKAPDAVDLSLHRVNLSEYPPGADGRAKFAAALLTSGPEVRPIVQDLMQNHEVWTAWRNSLFSAILFAGKGRAAAYLVSENRDLEQLWASQLEQLLTDDPNALTEIMIALSHRNAGDVGYTDQLAKWRKQLMQANTANQVFFEQMLTDPSGGYREQVDALCRKLLSNYEKIISS